MIISAFVRNLNVLECSWILNKSFKALKFLEFIEKCLKLLEFQLEIQLEIDCLYSRGIEQRIFKFFDFDILYFVLYFRFRSTEGLTLVFEYFL